MGNIKSRALLYLYFVNLFIKKQSTPHHRDKQRKSRKRAVSNRPKKPILRQPRFSDKMNLAKGEKHLLKIKMEKFFLIIPEHDLLKCLLREPRIFEQAVRRGKNLGRQ